VVLINSMHHSELIFPYHATRWIGFMFATPAPQLEQSINDTGRHVEEHVLQIALAQSIIMTQYNTKVN